MLTVYKSSAGSGKTYTLVKSFLSLVLLNPEFFSRILAVTFTNKATAEIKQRIIEKLADLAYNKDKAYLKTMAADLKRTETELTNNASYALQLILHNYSKLSVQTIDSFFNTTVRSLANELQLPIQFEVELNDKLVNQLLVESLLAASSTDDELEKLLETFAFEKMEEDKGWNPEKELEQIAGELFKEKFRSLAQSGPIRFTDAEVTKLASAMPNQFEKQMQNFGAEYLSEFDAYSFKVEDFTGKTQGVYSYFSKLGKGKIDAPSSAAEKTYEKINSWSSNALIEEKAEAVLRPILDKTIKYYKANIILYNTCKAIRNLLYVSPLIEKLEKMLRDYRSENDVVMMADINHIIQTFINRNNAEFVFEKTGSRYHSFLIDEFQDTSNFQWNNFKPLIENALAEGHTNLVVGDVKQSIYRWRGGNMKLLYKTIYKNLIHFSDIIKTELLNTNYRSKRTVVEFNNTVFSAAPDVLAGLLNEECGLLVGEVYKPQDVAQKFPAHNSDEGYVRIEYLPGENKDHDEKFKTASLNRMLACINGLINRNYSYSDIAILVRTNTEGSEAAEFLISNGIKNIVTSESLMLNAAPQINLLIHAFKWIANDEDELAGVIIENELAFINNIKHESFQSCLNSEAIRFLNENRNQFRQQTLYEVAEQLVSYFGLNKQPDAYIIRFLEILLELNAKHIYTLDEILLWWDDNQDKEVCSVITTEQGNAIKITTIHRSKGLQFRIVIMPFVDWSTKPKANELMWLSTETSPFNNVTAYPVLFNKSLSESFFQNQYIAEESEQLIDNLNLLYVAFTRAEEQLFAFSKLYKDMSDCNKAGKLLFNLLCTNDDWKSVLESDSKLELGNCELINTKKVIAEPTTSISNIISNRWSQKLQVKATGRNSQVQTQQDFGSMVHYALSCIKSVDDTARAVDTTRKVWTISETEAHELLTTINSVIEKSNDRNWWNGTYEIKNEPEIFYTTGEIVRPDRLMIKDNEVIVVDYKTGAKENKHKIQVDVYADCLTKMGYRVTEKHLLYLEPFELQSW